MTPTDMRARADREERIYGPTDLAAMLRVDSLRALQDAVKAGGDVPRPLYAAIPYHPDIPTHHLTARIINNGDDMTAALALHNAVLPGWGWHIEGEIAAVWHPETHGVSRDFEEASTPARAWLLAILAALVAQEEGKA